MSKKLIVGTGIVAFFLLLHTVLFWGGSGTVFDLIEGNLSPSIELNDRTVSHQGGSSDAFISVRATIHSQQPIHIVLPEYLSFTLDTSQLVGGKWWNPKANQVETGSGTKHAPVFDFNRRKLDMLVSGLTPAYLRIGGSEADKVYYDLNDTSEYVEKEKVPEGYHQTMTARQWDNLNAFVKRNNLKFVFTLNSGPSARDEEKRWDPSNAESLMRYSKEKGYQVDVFELGNEHNLFWYIYGLSQIVNPAQYRSDIKALTALRDQYYPSSKVGSQGSAIWPVLGELLGAFFGFYQGMFELSGKDVDLLAWHYYPQQSRRGPFASRRAHPTRLLEPDYLDEAAYWANEFTVLRDEHAPGKGIWLGETGNAQFGGEPGVSDVYIGGLWWLDQLGVLAANGVEAVFRQTLAGMNYGMMNPDTLELNPDYWNSLLWKKLMGTGVYRTELAGEDNSQVRLYAHKSADGSGVSALIINLDTERRAKVEFQGLNSDFIIAYEITTPDVLGKTVLLNGKELKLVNGENLPEIMGRNVSKPEVFVNPLSYTFVQINDLH